MLSAITQLLMYQLLGEVLVAALGVPVPGPVVGMLLLFLTLVARGGAAPALRDASQTLLRHLALLFVPAGVGVMVHAGRVAAEWLPIMVALAASTAASLLVTAFTLQALAGRRAARERPDGG